jgi:hypothetical protein
LQIEADFRRVKDRAEAEETEQQSILYAVLVIILAVGRL